MLLPQGSWIVVMRHVKDITSRGDIIKGGLSEESAKRVADFYSQRSPSHFYWAMHRVQYETPFAAGETP